MSLWNTRERWGWPAKLFHWTVAVMILGLAVVGTYMSNFVDDMFVQYDLTQRHKSFGFVVFALALARLAWRLANPVSPDPPAGQPRWKDLVARWIHRALYVLMFAIPVSGWLMASASILNDDDAYPARIPNEVFGLFELPDPIQPGSEALSDLLHTIHTWSVYLLAALLVIHVGAALRHHLVNGNSILGRMLF